MDLFINYEPKGTGLSAGELCQWLLDLNKNLSPEEQEVFQSELGKQSGQDFEDFLYSDDFKVPTTAKMGEDFVIITADTLI